MIEPLCRNQNVLVVGSGPNYQRFDNQGVVIGANGGAALQDCNILCTTSHLFRDGVIGQEFATRRSLIARHFSSIWLDSKSGFSDGFEGLRRHNIQYNILYNCDPLKRKEIVQGACGVDLWVSTGVFAVCLAIYSEAKVVRLSGVSLSNGHASSEDKEPRMHISEDRQCLNMLLETFPGLVLQESLMEQL